MPFDGVEVDLRRAVLLRAIELIEKGWTRRTLARDSRGWEVSPEDPTAVRFCARGAIWRASRDLGVAFPGVDAMQWNYIERFNDGSTSKHAVIGWLCIEMEKCRPDWFFCVRE